MPVPANQQLRGLDAGEARALITILHDAQAKLQAGEFQSFELLSGSIAGYEMIDVAPRDAFLQVRFEQAWNVERIPDGNQAGQLFELAYAPQGLGQLYWEIEVLLGSEGELERVSMTYKPPAPF